jgi:tetratricopeptide (TPR) repeat protein
MLPVYATETGCHQVLTVHHRRMSAINSIPRRSFLVVCLVLVVVTFAVYSPILHHGFVNYDDPDYITGNPQVTAGLTWPGIVWAFQTTHAANWHPLTWMSHMADCDLFGLYAGGHHLINLLFHIANTLLLFLWLNRMTGALWRSAFVAAFFAWHPMHVESVAWVAERKDVLSTFFWLLTLMAYTRNAKGGTRPAFLYYGLALFLFACGLMSKPMVVTLPFVLLLLDYWPLNRLAFPAAGKISEFIRTVLRLVIEKIPFFALAAASCMITYFAQQDALWSSGGLSLQFRVANTLISYVRYMAKLFWPTDLALIYPYPHQWTPTQVGGAALLLAACVVVFALRMRKNPYLVVGWFWFLGTLVPAIGLVQVGIQSMADRYTYIPSIGLFIVVVWGLNDLMNGWPEGRKFLALAGGVALAGCLMVTSIQINYWADSVKLFSHTIAVTRDNYAAYNCLGDTLEKLGRKDEALQLYARTVEIEPDFPAGQFNLGMMLLEHGQPDEALKHLDIAARLNPDNPVIQFDLGLFLLQHGKPGEAVGHFTAALKDKPEFPEARRYLEQALGKTNSPANQPTP